MELITKLGIDWKLLTAQIVNFLILMIVLYKVAYRPILEMLDKRSKTIEKGLHDAKKSEEKVQEIHALSEKRMAETAHEVGRMLEQAKHDAENMKKEIMQTAATQAEDLLKRTRIQIAEEKEKLLAEVKSEVSSLVLALTGKILEKEFSKADQERLVSAISHEMKSL